MTGLMSLKKSTTDMKKQGYEKGLNMKYESNKEENKERMVKEQKFEDKKGKLAGFCAEEMVLFECGNGKDMKYEFKVEQGISAKMDDKPLDSIYEKTFDSLVKVKEEKELDMWEYENHQQKDELTLILDSDESKDDISEFENGRSDELQNSTEINQSAVETMTNQLIGKEVLINQAHYSSPKQTYLQPVDIDKEVTVDMEIEKNTICRPVR
jgi:hypothetical protein